jgi:hypothetical protein
VDAILGPGVFVTAPDNNVGTLLGNCFPVRLGQNVRSQARNGGPRRIIQKLWGKGEIMNTSQRAAETRFRMVETDALPEREEEARKIRRLQLMVSMVMSVLGQDPNLTIEEASELAAGAKRAALAMFPDKELAYDILYKPRLQRVIRERFRLQ